MKNIVSTLLFLLCFATANSQVTADHPLNITFESRYEVAGKKFSIEELGLESSDQWGKYNYLVLEMKASSPQRFQLGFNTDWGYNELRIMPYSVGEWSRICIPLHLYREKPKPSHDLATYNNIPNVMAWYNLGGYTRGELSNVDWIGVRMHAPVDNPILEIRSFYFSEDNPGDKYYGAKPLIDEFGQWNIGDYKGKAHSLEELQAGWKKEEQEISRNNHNYYSKYGGYINEKIDEGTGFFRTKKIDDRWWFVDPEGYLFLSVAVDCINPDGGTIVKMLDKRPGVYKAIPPQKLNGIENNNSFGIWNLQRRYGDDTWLESWKEMTLARMDQWGVNTIGNWSSDHVINTDKKAFMLSLEVLGLGGEILGLANVYTPDFTQKINEVVKEQVSDYVNNPWLIGWFTGNEPAWLGEELRLVDLIQEKGDPHFQEALKNYLSSGDTPARRKQFVYDSFRIFLQTVDSALSKYDPNHLHIGIRLGQSDMPADEILEICRDVYDVYSFNSYTLTPSKEYMDKISEKTGLPLIIGEFHFGTTDRGMAQSLWQVDTQEERGVAYRYYVENGYAHPALIGTAYFQWSDQPTTGRTLDGENYNCGLIDVVDLPYPHQVSAMSESAERLYGIHKGEITPVSALPKRPRGYGMIPDKWNE